MTETIKEQLSAFLDGELPEAETTLLLKRLERDDDLRATLSRYSLIGAVMRQDDEVLAGTALASRVSAAIADEAPGAPARRGWAAPLAGLGVAASVAVVTLALFNAGLGPQGPMTAAAPDLAQADSAGGPVEIVEVVAPSATAAPTYTVPTPASGAAPLLPPAQLASFLLAHGDYTSPIARGSVVSAPIVAQPAVERQDEEPAPTQR
ncbi:MAG: sigma-E factor negative regulatory protein [Steroidobacteraceae bacterium]